MLSNRFLGLLIVLPALALSSSGASHQAAHAAPYAAGSISAPRVTAADQQPGSPDEQAAALAATVHTGGDGARAALQSALSLAGFGVLGADGSVLVAPAAPSQGLAFQDWELDAVLASLASGFAAPLDNTGQALQAVTPELDGIPIDQFMLDGVRSHAQDAPSPLRFWARFIVALGKQAQPPYDLLGEVDPASVRLDAVQYALLLRRFAGDLFALGQQASGAPTAEAVWASIAGPADQSAPCSLTETQGTIMDLGAVAAGIGFDKLMEYLHEAGIATAGNYSSFTTAANIALTYGKLAATLSAFKADISMDPPGPPLVRTKKQRPQTGEQRQLTARVRMDIGSAQVVNCLRPLLNAAGLDFSLPSDGAIGGAEVTWTLVKGGVQDLNVQDAIVEFYGNPVHQRADEQGMASVGVEGLGQRSELSDNAVPVMKQATVRLDTVIKPANMLQDLVDATAVAGGLAGKLGMPAELLYRTGWGFEYDYSFAVQDWQEAHYELDFDSTVVMTGTNFLPDVAQHVTARVPLTHNPATDKWSGRAEVQYQATKGNAPNTGCSYSLTADGGGTLEVTDVTIHSSGDDPGVIATVRIPDVRGTLNQTCAIPGLFSNTIPMPLLGWIIAWTDNHQDEAVAGEPGMFAFFNWQKGSGDVIARKHYDRTAKGGIAYHETTTLELKLVPEQ